ncbi:hypothetical protein F2P81_008425 [Scophthalmus maximus]|uniref:Uncharacterized protein n=1 Tax=Scophthalmus maximus TaxID=52904 RepID=A0A6A4T885_SCOMX|nr:hypothetical protein F2P81_008425 [Scophthalmus maximus]
MSNGCLTSRQRRAESALSQQERRTTGQIAVETVQTFSGEAVNSAHIRLKRSGIFFSRRLFFFALFPFEAAVFR